MSTSFDAFEEEKEYSKCEPSWDEKIDWSRSGSFINSSPVSSESDVPPPPPSSDLSDSSYSTFAEHISSSFSSSSSSSSSSDNNDDDDINDGAATSCVEVFGALLERYEDDYTYDESVEISGNNNLESCLAVLGRFALRCALDHWKCAVAKETEKCKQKQRQQACLELLQILKRVQIRRSLLLWYQTNKRIAWQESVLEAILQKNMRNAFRSWRDITTSSNRRRKVYFLMMIFNRWRDQTEECVSRRQKKVAALMHWARRLTQKSFSALKLHTAAQREDRMFKSSFRSPEQSLVWRRNSTSDYSSQSRFGDQERRYSCLEYSKDMNSLRSPFHTISPSVRFNRNRFQEFGSLQPTSRYSSYHLTGRQTYSSGMMQNSGMRLLSQPTSSRRMSTNQNDFTIPYAYAADDLV